MYPEESMQMGEPLQSILEMTVSFERLMSSSKTAVFLQGIQNYVILSLTHPFHPARSSFNRLRGKMFRRRTHNLFIQIQLYLVSQFIRVLALLYVLFTRVAIFLHLSRVTEHTFVLPSSSYFFCILYSLYSTQVFILFLLL